MLKTNPPVSQAHYAQLFTQLLNLFDLKVCFHPYSIFIWGISLVENVGKLEDNTETGTAIPGSLFWII